MSHHFVICLVRRSICRSGDISSCNKILYSYNRVVYEYITRQMLIHDNMYCPGCTPYLANTCQSHYQTWFLHFLIHKRQCSNYRKWDIFNCWPCTAKRIPYKLMRPYDRFGLSLCCLTQIRPYIKWMFRLWDIFSIRYFKQLR